MGQALRRATLACWADPSDTLDWVTLIMALEDRFAVDIPDEDAAELRTVKQVSDYVALALDANVSLQRRTAA